MTSPHLRCHPKSCIHNPEPGVACSFLDLRHTRGRWFRCRNYEYVGNPERDKHDHVGWHPDGPIFFDGMEIDDADT